MDYEKKYKEALEKARQFSERPLQEDSSSIVENIFPELKESEDERIRKELKRAIDVALDYSYFDKETADGCLAWLEKQGEQKPIEFKWSADDKNKLLIIEQILDCANLLISSQELTEIKNWLKSLKQRIGE